MDDIEEQTQQFISEIENKLNYYVDEFQISPHTLLGALEYVKVSYAKHIEEQSTIYFDPDDEGD